MATDGEPMRNDTGPDERDRPVHQGTRGPAVTWIAVATVIVLFGVVGFVLLRPTTDGNRLQPGGQAAPAPEVSLTDFDQQPFTLAEYRGTPVVVNFWASWCPFCIAEMPDFEKVHQSLEGQVEFVGIAQRDDFEAAKRLAEETGVTYRLVQDPQGRAYDAMATGAMPTTAFVDEEGTIVEVVGAMLTEPQLRELITKHFGISG